MFGRVIEIRDTLLVLGVCCVIGYIVLLVFKLRSAPNTNQREGYNKLLTFSTWTILLPGILFLIGYYLLRARVAYSSNQLKKRAAERKQNPFRENNNNNNNNNNSNKNSNKNPFK